MRWIKIALYIAVILSLLQFEWKQFIVAALLVVAVEVIDYRRRRRTEAKLVEVIDKLQKHLGR